MKKGRLGTTFLKKNTEDFVALNLGNYYLKGLIAQGNTVSDSFLEKYTNLSTGIKRLWDEKKISTRRVRLSLKNPNCLVRYFNFPKAERKRLQQSLYYEMNKFIPFSAQEVYFDFFVLKETSPSQVLLLLAVAKKEFIDNILEVFSPLNVEISAITLDSICLANLYLNNYPQARESNACILDIGYKYSTITIFNKGTPFLTRDVKINAKDIFQIISRIKNIPLDKADVWAFSLKDNSEFLELAQESISNLCKEMKNSFDYFEVNSGEHIQKLYLSGGLTAIKGVTSLFSEFLDTNVELLEVLPGDKNSLKVAFTEKQLAKTKHNLAVPFGLVL